MRRIAKGDISDLTERNVTAEEWRSCKENILKAEGCRCGVIGSKEYTFQPGGGCALQMPTNPVGPCKRSAAARMIALSKRPARRLAFKSDVSRLLQTGSFTQQGGFVGFFPWEMFTTKVTVCSGFFVDWVQQIQHLNQAVWTQVEELAHQ